MNNPLSLALFLFAVLSPWLGIFVLVVWIAGLSRRLDSVSEYWASRLVKRDSDIKKECLNTPPPTPKCDKG